MKRRHRKPAYKARRWAVSWERRDRRRLFWMHSYEGLEPATQLALLDSCEEISRSGTPGESADYTAVT